MIFSMISKIEVALRVRLVEALLIHGEPLVLQDSSIFKEKKLYWQNMSTVAVSYTHLSMGRKKKKAGYESAWAWLGRKGNTHCAAYH